MKSWTSPSHRPLKSCDYGTAIKGEPLSNRRIDNLMRSGRYGTDLRDRILARDKLKKAKTKRKPPPPKSFTLDDLL